VEGRRIRDVHPYGVLSVARVLEVSSNICTVQIAQAVAPESNVQSVVFAWPQMWVANAVGLTRAAHSTYHELDARELFE